MNPQLDTDNQTEQPEKLAVSFYPVLPGKLCPRCHDKFVTSEYFKDYYHLEPARFVDGESELCYFCQEREAQIRATGYEIEVELNDKVGYSELGIHMKIAERFGVRALIHKEHCYVNSFGQPSGSAYVLLDTGRWVQGNFWNFGEGRFSLS